MLLLIANAWLAVALMLNAVGARKHLVRWCVGAWGAFLFIGWLGVSAQMFRYVILPRSRDPELPVRLAVAYQNSNDLEVFDGHSMIVVPHPYPETSVLPVLKDPRMQNVLPPSLQPDRPMGPLSRSARWILRRE
jgi:hypothetical protein